MPLCLNPPSSKTSSTIPQGLVQTVPAFSPLGDTVRPATIGGEHGGRQAEFRGISAR